MRALPSLPTSTRPRPAIEQLAHLYLRTLWRQVRLERLQQGARIESLLGSMLEVADRLRRPGELDVVETSFRALALDAYRDPEAAMREALLALPLLHERPNAPGGRVGALALAA